MGSEPHRHMLCLTAVFLSLSASPATEGDIRLHAFEATRCSGTVQIFHNNAWGTVCSNIWNLNEMTVACRELGCGSALCVSRFCPKTGQTWAVDLMCSGEESSLTVCQHTGFKTYNSEHCNAVDVVCLEGLPSPNVSISPVGDLTWGEDVSVTCSVPAHIHQLVQGNFTLTKVSDSVKEHQMSGRDSTAFTTLKMVFENEGWYQCRYQTTASGRNFTSLPSKSVMIAVRLQQPNISLESPENGLLWGPDVAEVTVGGSFVINCTTFSHYPTGEFVLIFSGSNVTSNKSAVNHSASFHFPAAEYEHEGNYSCMYEVTWSERLYITEPTATIRLVVKAPMVLLLSSVAAGLLLLLLLVLVSVCLVRRRGQEARRSGTPVQTQMAFRNSYGHDNNDDDDDDDDDSRDYVNVQQLDGHRKWREEARATEEDSDDPDYENQETENNYIEVVEISLTVQNNREEEGEDDNDEETSDDETDYVNVTELMSIT